MSPACPRPIRGFPARQPRLFRALLSGDVSRTQQPVPSPGTNSDFLFLLWCHARLQVLRKCLLPHASDPFPCSLPPPPDSETTFSIRVRRPPACFELLMTGSVTSSMSGTPA